MSLCRAGRYEGTASGCVHAAFAGHLEGTASIWLLLRWHRPHPKFGLPTSRASSSAAPVDGTTVQRVLSSVGLNSSETRTPGGQASATCCSASTVRRQAAA